MKIDTYLEPSGNVKIREKSEVTKAKVSWLILLSIKKHVFFFTRMKMWTHLLKKLTETK